MEFRLLIKLVENSALNKQLIFHFRVIWKIIRFVCMTLEIKIDFTMYDI